MGPEGGATVEASATIRVEVYVVDRVISIELYPLDWVLTGVKLAAKINNVMADGTFQHVMYNTGSVSVLVDIGYGPYIAQGIVPGLEQGTDVFTTEVERGDLGMTVIPPNDRIKMVNLAPGEKSPLHFVYGAPTAVSDGASQHGVTYEMRAYADIIDPGI